MYRVIPPRPEPEPGTPVCAPRVRPALAEWGRRKRRTRRAVGAPALRALSAQSELRLAHAPMCRSRAPPSVRPALLG